MKNLLLVLSILLLTAVASFSQNTIKATLCHGVNLTLHLGEGNSKIKPVIDGYDVGWFKLISNEYNGNVRVFSYYNLDGDLVKIGFSDGDRSAAYSLNNVLQCEGIWFEVTKNNY